MKPTSNKFTYSALSASIALINTCMTTSVFAQDEAAALEEIVVTGIRGSLTQAMDIKRDASGVVDAISAEDIGKFPDTNLAESLQRITGVSIDRSNNEGNKVSVRGFGPEYNLVTLNNRQMPSSSSLAVDGIPRSFNFQAISAETVSGVEVYKTGKAHVASGGIGATINMKTARPFDYDGFQASGSMKGVMDTSNEKGDDITPEFSGMISQTFADGKFGVLLALSHAERDSRRDRVGTQLDGWRRSGFMDTSNIDTSRNPDQIAYSPFTVEIDVADIERERQNGQLVLQFAPTDNITATLDYTASRFKETTAMNRHGLWFDNPTNAVTDANGSLSSVTFTPADLDFWAWDIANENENDSVGLNLEWHATDNLRFSFDAHQSTSESNPNGDFSETLANSHHMANSPITVDIAFGGDIPNIAVDGSGFAGGLYNKDNIVSDLYQKRGKQIKNTISQYQFDGVWEDADGGPLKAIKFGIHSTEYETDHKNFSTFSFVTIDLDPVDFSFESVGDTADEFGSGVSNGFPFIARYSANQFVDQVEAEGQFFLNPPTEDGVTEETLAAYVSMDFETDFNDLPVRINAGVRFEDTDVTTFSLQPGIVALNYRNPAGMETILSDEVTRNTLKGGYTSVLPNLDVSIDITDDLVGRFSYNRTLGRPSVSTLFPSTSGVLARPGGPYDASQGNPNLLPLESDNFDFSLEWYYAEGSYASITYFKKYTENFFGDTFEERPILDVNGQPLTDPSANPRPGCPDESVPPNPACLNQATDPVIMFNVSTTGNLTEEEIDGIEFNVQHLFGDTGFGAIINYTTVDGSAEFDPYNFDTAEGLQGLSDSANVIAFWEKHGWQVRAAYNWRDDFLLSFSGFGEPTITEEYSQIDLNVSYEINDSMSVFFEGLNLTEETTRRHGRFEEQLIDAEQYGARYNIGLRAKF